ncbi:hypothetical protein DPEC_G00304430 [Dallia pectoralis]|uniref:Uncharacterized protein n=1 Tax=Dallia pectoralis TaxID=75939 RepID=A0ACC2FDK9_DALPE|nr:hypothetical protein DPEC_G00304430 [Dallia pectoralis]
MHEVLSPFRARPDPNPFHLSIGPVSCPADITVTSVGWDRARAHCHRVTTPCKTFNNRTVATIAPASRLASARGINLHSSAPNRSSEGERGRWQTRGTFSSSTRSCPEVTALCERQKAARNFSP